MNYWTGIRAGVPAIHPALSRITVGPFVASEGKRKLTWYPSTSPGRPTAPSTSAGFPFTATSMGEFTTAGGSDGNGWPGSIPGRVGPSPVANSDRISPAAAGRDALTGEKSLECVIAGTPELVAISGRDDGITYMVNMTWSPRFTRRLAA